MSESLFFIVWDIDLEVELFIHMVILCLIFFFFKKPSSWCFYFMTTKNYPPE